jgi:hypothetical protein
VSRVKKELRGLEGTVDSNLKRNNRLEGNVLQLEKLYGQMSCEEHTMIRKEG